MIGKLLLAGLFLGGVVLAFPRAEPAPPVPLAQSPDEVLARLRAERRIVEGTGMGSLTLAADGREGDALLIGITGAGTRAQAHCRVRVTPAPEGGSIPAIDCTQPGADDRPIRRVGSKALEIVVTEHVRATAAARPYDIDGVANAMMALVLTNRPVIGDSLARGE